MTHAATACLDPPLSPAHHVCFVSCHARSRCTCMCHPRGNASVAVCMAEVLVYPCDPTQQGSACLDAEGWRDQKAVDPQPLSSAQQQGPPWNVAMRPRSSPMSNAHSVQHDMHPMMAHHMRPRTDTWGPKFSTERWWAHAPASQRWHACKLRLACRWGGARCGPAHRS